jgi:hypothetical protein
LSPGKVKNSLFSTASISALGSTRILSNGAGGSFPRSKAELKEIVWKEIYSYTDCTAKVWHKTMTYSLISVLPPSPYFRDFPRDAIYFVAFPARSNRKCHTTRAQNPLGVISTVPARALSAPGCCGLSARGRTIGLLENVHLQFPQR